MWSTPVQTARMLIAADCMYRVVHRWFKAQFWEGDPEPHDLLVKIDELTDKCSLQAVGNTIYPVSKAGVKRICTGWQRRIDSVAKRWNDCENMQVDDGYAMLCIAHLYAASCMVSDVCNCVTEHDLTYWRMLHEATESMLDKWLLPFFPQAEDTGADIYHDAYNGK